MSTDDTLVPQDPAPAAPISPPSVAAPAEAAADAPRESAPPPPAPPADTPAASPPPKRKLELRPTLDADHVRPIASYGNSSTHAPAAAVGPVAVPTADDHEVQVVVAQVAANVTAEDLERPPPVDVPEPVVVPHAEAIDAALEADIEAAMAGANTAPQVAVEGEAAPLTLETLQQGQKIRGTILSINADAAFVDVGLRLSAAVPTRQFNPKKPPQVGDTLEMIVDKVDETEGLILANLPRGVSKVAGEWDAISEGQVVECICNKTNKGGLEVSVSSLRGFIPASQVDLNYIADLQTFVGQKLRVRVMEVKPAKRKLVLSRRVLLAEEREGLKKELLEELKPDQVRTGRVKTIKEYGAFVDLGGMDGFLPVSQMSWVRIGHPSEVLAEGQEIEVKVLSIDREKDRISLGMRQLAPNPWRTAETKYEKGSTVTGRVTKVEAFGAFVELEPGVEGLVHISELDHRRVNRVTEVLNVGDMPEVQIIEVDPKKKRISLSVKALKAKPEPVEKPKPEEPPKPIYERKHKSPLKGGTGTSGRGGLFGNPRDFGG